MKIEEERYEKQAAELKEKLLKELYPQEHTSKIDVREYKKPLAIADPDKLEKDDKIIFQDLTKEEEYKKHIKEPRGGSLGEQNEELESPSLEDCLKAQIKDLTKNSLDAQSIELESQPSDEELESQPSDEALESQLSDEALESPSLDGQSKELTNAPLKKHIEELKKKLKKKSSNNLSSYEILGLNTQASQEEIKKRFQDLLQIAHPDKGGDNDTFTTILKAFESLYKDKINNADESNDKNNKEDEQVGLRLIKEGCTPYISHSAFLKLQPELDKEELTAEQKKLVLLLGRQRRIYCQELISKYNGIDLKSIDASAIDFNSVDLDSVYLSPENQEEIFYLSQKANLSCHSLNGMQAITTEITSPDDPVLYVVGWKLLHEKPGIDSGAVKLFKTWNREQRKKLAIELGNKKINHSEANITEILDMHDSVKNPTIEQNYNDLMKTPFRSIELDLIQAGNISPTKQDIMFELHCRALAQPAYYLIIKKFSAELKRFNISRDDNDWYQVGINSIKSPGGMLAESAFSLLSPEAQRHVAIELGKMSEGYSLGNPSLYKLIFWANTQLAKNSGLDEMDLLCSNDSPEPRYQAENNKEETFDEEGLKEQLALALSKVKASIFLKDLFEKSQKAVGFMLTYESQRTEPPVQASRASSIPKKLSFLENSQKRSRSMITDKPQSTEPPTEPPEKRKRMGMG